MVEIVLTTLNAKYIHAAFGLRYLMANLGPLKTRACILEFDINQRPLDVAESLLASDPKIIGFGVYIWNVTPTTEVVAAIKRVRPEVTVILGGPEVSYETETQPIVQLADYVITGEADLKFAELCQSLLVSGAQTSPSAEMPCHARARKLIENDGSPSAAADRNVRAPKVLPAELPDFSQLVLPYDLYDDRDIAHRVIYVEASRGCPFTCEFCLSSLDIPVRQAPLPSFLEHLQRLLDRGVKQFKFVDRTFNLNANVSRTILEFLLDRCQPGHFFHFEMIPDRLPEGLREILARFPPGALQFEVGIQTFNEEVAALIKRRQNYQRLEENLQFLRACTGVYVHADLIAGLPGESLDSFGAGFDRLVGLQPHEIQVGILKRLRGTPIARHDVEWQMVYNPHPPYEILQTKLIDFATMQKLRRFARYWDLVGNSGNFVETTSLIWGDPKTPGGPSAEFHFQVGVADKPGNSTKSPFQSFMRWSEWLHARVGRTDSIALSRLMEFLFDYLTGELKLNRQDAAQKLWSDYQRGGRRDIPNFLREHLEPNPQPRVRPLPKREGRPSSVAALRRVEGEGKHGGRTKGGIPKRQRRHLV
jgi:radical SAM superfamily enzyme YgiQ (UPF0313 family)